MAFKKLGPFFRKLKNKLGRKKTPIAESRTNPRFKKLYRLWPELPKLEFEAITRLREQGKSKLHGEILRVVVGGTASWIPEGKRPAATDYVLLGVAGIKIEPDKLKLLDLEEEKIGLDSMIKNYK